MQIAIVGTGAIGSVFAYQFARAGHEVTVVARGARLEELQRDQAIVLVSGERAAVRVRATLDATTPYDLALVTVRAPQVDTVLPELRASAAKTVMFMFNTFEPLEPLRDAVGAERFAFGFPGGIIALLPGGKLEMKINPGTTVGDAAWIETFKSAGIPTVFERDMHSWLRSHAAVIVPLMAIGSVVFERGAGITMHEARTHAAAMANAFSVVRSLGHTVTPSYIDKVSRLPQSVIAGLFWALSRTQMVRGMGSRGPGEARMLIDMISAAAPGTTDALLAIRP